MGRGWGVASLLEEVDGVESVERPQLARHAHGEVGQQHHLHPDKPARARAKSTLSRTCWPVMATAFAAGGDVIRPAAAATGAHLVVLAAAAATAAAVGVETLMVGVGFTFRCRACTVTGEALPCAGRAGWWGTHGAATDLCFQRGAARVAPAP